MASMPPNTTDPAVMLDWLRTVLPQAEPWFPTVLQIQLPIAITGTLISSLPLLLLLHRTSLTSPTHLSALRTIFYPFTTHYEPSVPRAFIIPSPSVQAMWLALIMNCGTIASGILCGRFLEDPLRPGTDIGLWSTWAVWGFTSGVMASACAGCGLTALLSPTASGTRLHALILRHPRLLNILVLSIPLCFLLLIELVAAIAHIHISRFVTFVRSLGLVLSAAVESGDAERGVGAIRETWMHLEEMKERGKMVEEWMTALNWATVSVCVALTILCIPSLFFVFRLTHAHLHTTIDRLRPCAIRSVPSDTATSVELDGYGLDVASATRSEGRIKLVRWRYRTHVVQWAIAGATLLGLTVWAFVFAIRWRGFQLSRRLLNVAGAACLLIAPVANTIISAITLARMLLLESPSQSADTRSAPQPSPYLHAPAFPRTNTLTEEWDSPMMKAKRLRTMSDKSFTPRGLGYEGGQSDWIEYEGKEGRQTYELRRAEYRTYGAGVGAA